MALLSIAHNNNNDNNGAGWKVCDGADAISRGRSPGRDVEECSAATALEACARSAEAATQRERERGMVSRLGIRFRRYCRFLAHSPHGGAAPPEDETEAEASSLEQLTGSRSSSRSRRRRSSSIGSAGSRLKMRLRRCTSSPG
ncbi:uncharacterized protein LOC116802166 [Drosophila sechellia]|nr:uncharacterized protein LOC116802166 [Drosophila sechellia]